jgi:hypothetical protein
MPIFTHQQNDVNRNPPWLRFAIPVPTIDNVDATMLPRISRRDFLQRAALLSAALALPGRDLPALGADAPHTNAPLDIFSYGVTVVKAILSRYATSFTVREGAVKNKRDYHLIVQKPLVIDGRKKDELWFASVIQQKHNVGFYFMPLCCCTKLQDCRIEVKALISPELLKHLDGKCCFHMKSLTPELKKDIDAALKLGFAAYKKQKWL